MRRISRKIFTSSKEGKNLLLSLLFIITGLIYFICLIYSDKIFSYDESFSIAMTKLSYSDIWRTTSADVHPPLYYFSLKTFIGIFGNSLFAFHIFSLIGFLGALLLGLFPIRKYWGEKVSVLFIFILILIPASQYTAVEIRMYSWAMFFTLATLLSAYRIYNKGKIVNYISLLVFSLCAAYTHYYAFLTVLCIFFILFAYQLYTKKDLKKLTLVLLLFLAFYSFWLPELFSQINSVNKNYWIETIGIWNLLQIFYYSIFPVSYFDAPSFTVIFTLIGVSLWAVLLLMYGYSLYKKTDKSKQYFKFAVICLLIFFSPILIGLCYSLLVRPVIVARYTICAMGILVLALSILLSEIFEKNKKGKIIVLITFLIILSLNISRFISEKKIYKTKYAEWVRMETFFENNTSQNTVFLAPLYSAISINRYTLLYPDNLFFIYTPTKTHHTYELYNSIEVNKLPVDFDFYLVFGKYNHPLQNAENDLFREQIKDHFTIPDSLILSDHNIYRMRTIHREREHR